MAEGPGQHPADLGTFGEGDVTSVMAILGSAARMPQVCVSMASGKDRLADRSAVLQRGVRSSRLRQRHAAEHGARSALGSRGERTLKKYRPLCRPGRWKVEQAGDGDVPSARFVPTQLGELSPSSAITDHPCAVGGERETRAAEVGARPVIASSPSLQARLHELYDDAAEGLALELGGPTPDSRARLAAGAIVLTVRAREETVRAFDQGASDGRVTAAFFAVFEQGFDAVERLTERQ